MLPGIFYEFQAQVSEGFGQDSTWNCFNGGAHPFGKLKETSSLVNIANIKSLIFGVILTPPQVPLSKNCCSVASFLECFAHGIDLQWQVLVLIFGYNHLLKWTPVPCDKIGDSHPCRILTRLNAGSR